MTDVTHGEASSPDPNSEVQRAALGLVTTLPAATRDDPAAPYDPLNIELMRLLRLTDKAAFGNVRAQLRALRVSMRDLDAALGPEGDLASGDDEDESQATRLLRLAAEVDAPLGK